MEWGFEPISAIMREYNQSALATFPRILFPLMLINLTAHMALSGGRVAGSVFALKTGQSELVAGILMGLYALLPVLTAVQVGRWVDRAGAFVAIRVGVLCVIVGAAFPVMWLHITSMFISSALTGFGFNVVSIALQNSVGRVNARAPQEERLANFGWFAMSHSASSTVGPFVAGILIDAFGYKVAFGAMVASAMVALVTTLRARENLPTAQIREEKPGAVTPNLLSLLETPEMRRIYGVSMSMAVVWDLFIILLPVLGHRLGFSASVIGTTFALFALGTFAIRFATPWLSTRFREWEIMRTALVVMAMALCVLVAVSLALWPFLRSPFALMAVGFVLGAALGCGQPNMLSLLHTSAPQGRSGEAVGLRSLVGNASSVSVPVAFGAGAATFGIAPILFIGVLMIAGVIPAAHKGAVLGNNAGKEEENKKEDVR
jgi:MFS family permease